MKRKKHGGDRKSMGYSNLLKQTAQKIAEKSQ